MAFYYNPLLVCCTLFCVVFVWSAKAAAPGNVNCDAGWTDIPITGYCYRYNPHHEIWHSARAYCLKYRSQLLSIVTKAEQMAVAGFLSKLQESDVWTGGYDSILRRGGGWAWDDRKPFVLLNWDAGQPQYSHYTCMAIDTSTGRWIGTSCLYKKGSICKKPRSTRNPPTATTVTPVTLPNGKVWGCPEGWNSYKGSCYKMHKEQKGFVWQAAHESCLQRGGSLVSISDREENMFVYSLLPRGFPAAWIGLKYTRQVFSWSDNITPVTYTNWSYRNPFALSNACCFMSGKAKWSVTSCIHPTSVLVCERRMRMYDKGGIQQEGCPKGGKGHKDKCYKFFSSPKTFADGKSDCKSIGGHLATVRERSDQYFLAAEMFDHLLARSFWIGLSNTKMSNESKYMYTWESGARVTFTFWYLHHTGMETNTCVGLSRAHTRGFWHTYPCNTAMAYICEYPRTGVTTPIPIASTTTLFPCPTGWVTYGQMCYQAFYKTGDRKSWNRAKSACEKLVTGGSLASLTSKGLEDYLRTEFTKQHQEWRRFEFVWTGLHSQFMEGGYEWLDGQPFLYTNWDDEDLNNFKDQDPCVMWAMMKPNGKWIDQMCYRSNRYLCQAPRGANVVTTLTPPTVGTTAIQCGTQGWTMYNGYCYKRSFWETRNWFVARKKCQSMGAELVSFADKREHNYVIAVMQNSRALWTGLNDFDHDIYKWTDGTPVSFLPWLPNEPDDGGFGERCVAMNNHGKIYDYGCDNKLDYMCKKRLGSSSPITVVRTPPKGGCPQGFHGMPGTSQCYHVGGIQVKERKSMLDAFDACKSLFHRSRLASFHSNLDKSFVATMIAGLNTSLWIGLSRTETYWHWLDNTKIDYMHWAPFRIDRRSIARNCGSMLSNVKYAGFWMPFNCGNRHAYLCEYRKDVRFPAYQPNTDDCKKGYQKYRQSCYKYVSTPQTWSNSEDTCVKDGGHLIGIQDGFESAFLDLLLYPENQTDVWIGLKQRLNISQFIWSDAWPVVVTFWGKGQPDLSNQCVHGVPGSAWWTTSCQSKLPSVCEINKDPPPTATAPVPGKCPSKMWEKYGESCYFIESSKSKKWSEANYACKQMGAKFASIHSLHEFHFVSKLIGVRRMDYWLGMERYGLNSFEWSDRSRGNFWKWAKGSPSNKFTSCVLAQGIDGKWKDVACWKKYGYICKMKQVPLPTPSTTSSLTTPRTPSTLTTPSTPSTLTTPSTSSTPSALTTPSTPSTSSPRPTKATTKKTVPTPASTSTTTSTTTTTTTTTPTSTTTSTATSALVSSNTISPKSGFTIQIDKLSHKSDQAGLKSGEVAGIVIGCLAVIAIVIVVVVIWRKRSTKPSNSKLSVAFKNPLCDSIPDADSFLEISGVSKD